MKIPFVVKQFLSSDLEQGTYSRIFWYYPIQPELSIKGGIGMFFEVLSGDVDYEVYEQIAKRFWENFQDNFYEYTFEDALKRSFQLFLQLLRGFGVEEGIDVNMVLFNVGEEKGAHYMRIISFGETDIFVVREGKFADIGKLVPENKTLRDLKFLEVDLSQDDVLLIGNNTLVENALSSEVLTLTSLREVVASLEAFKEQLFGSKKIFFLGVSSSNDVDVDISDKKNVTNYVNKIKNYLFPIISKTSNTFNSLIGKIKGRKTNNTLAEEAPTQITDSDFEQLDEVNIPKEVPEPPTDSITQIDTDFSDTPENTVKPPKVYSTRRNETVEEMSSESTTSTEDESYEIIEEVSASATLDKSIYSEDEENAVAEKEVMENSTAAEEKVFPVEETPTIKQSVTPVSNKPINYAANFRAQRSPLKKLLKNPTIARIVEMFAGYSEDFRAWLQKITKGKLGKPVFVSRLAGIKGRNGLPMGAILMGVALIVLIILIVVARNSIVKRNGEKELITEIKTANNLYKNYNDNQVSRVITVDADGVLDKCISDGTLLVEKTENANKLLTKEAEKREIELIKLDVVTILNDCKTKYDEINGIYRVTSADLVTDLKIALGSESVVTGLTIREGSLLVVDSGKKAVYQIIPESKGIIKLEDPNNLVSDPIAVASGEGTIFACDTNSGIIQYAKVSGGAEQFQRVVGMEPDAIGVCSSLDGYGKNVYSVPRTGNVVFRAVGTGSTFRSPERYITGVSGVRDLAIDGHVYVLMVNDGVTRVSRYYMGKKDYFSLDQDIEILDATTIYTNPSSSRPLYLYDKGVNEILVIEKPTAKLHPGEGKLVKRIKFDNPQLFTDVKGFVVDYINSKELNMYVLAGSTVWKVRMPK